MGVLSIVNAEEFFGFKKGDFTCDIEVNDVIYPEETEKKKEETSLLYKTVNRLDKNKVDINTRTVTMVNQYARIGYCDDALYNKVYANLLCYPIKIQKEAIEEIREREKEQNKPIKNNYEPITKKKLDTYVSILSDMVEKLNKVKEE